MMSECSYDESKEWIYKEIHKPWHQENFATKHDIVKSSFEKTLYRIFTLNPQNFLYELLNLRVWLCICGIIQRAWWVNVPIMSPRSGYTRKFINCGINRILVQNAILWNPLLKQPSIAFFPYTSGFINSKCMWLVRHKSIRL